MRPAILATVVAVIGVLLSAGNAFADTTVAADPAARQVTALGGALVWVSGDATGQVLMQRTSAGTGPVPGAPEAAFYRSVDLGHDAHGRLVLTYQRCDSRASCVPFRDDLHGHRARIRDLTLPRCVPST